jgi:ribonuclease HI
VSRKKLFIYTDGAARGNPGPAGIGARILDSKGTVVAEECHYIGEATNNVAEYRALLTGLERAAQLGASTVEVRTDSELVVKQLRGEYRVRNLVLRELFERVKQLAAGFERVDYIHVRRELNRDADRLANRAIDLREGA